MCGGDTGNHRMIETPRARQRTVGFDDDVPGFTEFQQRFFVGEWVEFHLIDGGWHLAFRQRLFDVCDAVIADADRLDAAAGIFLLQHLPNPPAQEAEAGNEIDQKMDEKQIDIAYIEFCEAAVERVLRMEE